MKTAYLFCFVLLLSGCNPFSAYRQNSEEILKRDWAKSERFEEPDEMYCYRTLGDVVCYDNALPEGHKERLKGTADHEPKRPHKRTWKDDVKDGFTFPFPEENTE